MYTIKRIKLKVRVESETDICHFICKLALFVAVMCTDSQRMEKEIICLMTNFFFFFLKKKTLSEFVGNLHVIVNIVPSSESEFAADAVCIIDSLMAYKLLCFVVNFME